MGIFTHAYALSRTLVVSGAILLLVQGCGRSGVSTSFEAAAKKQTALDEMTLEIFKRSPTVDSGDASITARDDLDQLNRSSVVFTGVKDVKAAIASTEVKVFESPLSLTAPTFYEWAGVFIPTGKSAFQAMMGYYHVTKAKDFAVARFPSVDFSATTNKVFPITVYAKEDGAVTGTNYDPSDKSIHLFADSASAVPNFHIADEADSMYHEFGHAVQDATNKTVLNMPVSGFLDLYPYNRDLDSVLEGLADFYAAAVARDDAILSYLAANLPTFLDAKSRIGKEAYKRSLQNTLAFPDAYVRDAHLDGRVVASTLNDFRKLLTGDTLRLPVGCTSCTTLKLSAENIVDKATAYDRAVTLAYAAYAGMATTTSLYGYGTLLQSMCTAASSVSTWCSVTEVQTALASVLDSRGLVPTSPVANETALKRTGGVLDATTPDTGAGDLSISSTIGFMPFPNDTGFANSDANVDPCEVILVYPNITNSNTTESLYDITVGLEYVSGFTNMLNPSDSQPVEQVASYASSTRKVLGWLKPTENSLPMVDFYTTGVSSRWYTPQFGSYFAQKLSADYYPSELGWLVRAPATRGAVGSVRFKISYRRYNSVSIATYQTAIFTQTVTVNANTSGPTFCQ